MCAHPPPATMAVMARQTSLMPRAAGFSIGRLLGIEIRIDPTWLLWVGVLPIFWIQPSEGAVARQWLLGVLVAVLLGVCIVIHEMAHSITARAYGLPVRRITLFLFGGVSQIEREAPEPATEYYVALSGPLTSLVLATLLGGVKVTLYPDDPWDSSFPGFLAVVNLFLAMFNLVPAFPMDGGRILRSALWAWGRGRSWATRWAARAGRSFGGLLIAVGVGSIFALIFVEGANDEWWANWWFAFIGVFIYNAATSAEASEGGERPNEPPEVI